MTSHALFDQWTTYAKVVENDYMHHRAYFSKLAEHLHRRPSNRLSVLDLGCGDAKPIIPLLKAFDIERYIGIDESMEALERAGRALKEIGIDHQLIAASMEQATVTGKFDLIVASYSLHHLESPAKHRVLAWCFERLSVDGTMAVIDVFMEPGEVRNDYLDRWEQNARRDWSVLTSTEASELVEHVRSSDLPERYSDYQRLARHAGFNTISELAHGPDKLNKLIVLETQQ